jgi:hypothetical protein
MVGELWKTNTVQATIATEKEWTKCNAEGLVNEAIVLQFKERRVLRWRRGKEGSG